MSRSIAAKSAATAARASRTGCCPRRFSARAFWLRPECAASSRLDVSGTEDAVTAVDSEALVAVRWALWVLWAAAGREDFVPAPAAPAIASTRSPLRIFDVVFTPS